LCWSFSGLSWLPPRFMISLLLSLMVVLVVKFVCVALVILHFIIFELSFYGMSCVETYVMKTWRAHAGNGP
jgi:hypothetical protein